MSTPHKNITPFTSLDLAVLPLNLKLPKSACFVPADEMCDVQPMSHPSTDHQVCQTSHSPAISLFSPLWWVEQTAPELITDIISNATSSSIDEPVTNGGKYTEYNEVIEANNAETKLSWLYSLFSFEKSEEGHIWWAGRVFEVSRTKTELLDIEFRKFNKESLSANSALALLRELDQDTLHKFLYNAYNSKTLIGTDYETFADNMITYNNRDSGINILMACFGFRDSSEGSEFWCDIWEKISKIKVGVC